MSNASMRFITESLAATGFAVLRGQVAYTQRPDLWAHGMDASSDFADKTLSAKLNTFANCQIYLARFVGVEGTALIKVLARSPDQLEQRIEWITGFKATLLIHESAMVGELDPADVQARKIRADPNPQGGDVHAGTITAEPGRTCSECEWSSTGNGCANSRESSLATPQMNLPRRCKGFRPRFESHDGRTGRQLWPELWAVKA